MIARLRWLVAAIWLTAADAAAAHPAYPGARGFFGGVLHPVLVPMHLMAIVALGLLIGGQARWGRSVPAAYVLALATGLVAIALAYVPTRAEEALLSLTAIVGMLVAWARPLANVVGGMLAAGIGLALALDSPPEALSLLDGYLALLGTALAAAGLLVAAATLASGLRRDWSWIGMRILGSWIAASAIMTMALRLAR
jgi:urease accessory protein